MNLRTLTVALFSLLIGTSGRAQPTSAQDKGAPSEYEVKAAFLYNFAKFVEWPSGTFATSNAPVIIGILGRNPFGGELERMVKDKVLKGRPMVVQTVASTADPALKHCQILFIQPMDRDRTMEILGSLKGAPILTVSETDDFVKLGGMISFVMDGKRVRFEINDNAAMAAGLRISSKLLSLSKRTEAGQ
jgi:hypothetical protein